MGAPQCHVEREKGLGNCAMAAGLRHSNFMKLSVLSVIIIIGDLRWEWRIADPDDGLQLSVTVVTVSIGTRRLLKK